MSEGIKNLSIGPDIANFFKKIAIFSLYISSIKMFLFFIKAFFFSSEHILVET